MSGKFTRLLLQLLDRTILDQAMTSNTPAHQRTGQRGEEDAYFYLRRHGYVMVARNYRSPHHHGEIDLIGWNNNVLCFIEVKTRTTRDVKPAEAAVDRQKRRALRRVVGDYMRSLPHRRFPEPPPWRFDVVTVHYGVSNASPEFEVFQNAALSS